MKKNKVIQRKCNLKTGFMPKGMLCGGGYCYQCKNCVPSDKFGSDFWCLRHDRPAYRSEWHECCE